MTYNNNKETALPISFTPGTYDVICARGKVAKNHSGNRYYRGLIRHALERYSGATSCRSEKTKIVTEIVDGIRSKGGKFVKKGSSDNDGIYWYEVDDHLAREKIGQNLRDSLSSQYKSSTKAKRVRRVAAANKFVNDVDAIVRSSDFVNERMDRLRAGIERNGKSAIPEFFVCHLFTQTNREILESFKQDPELVLKFNNRAAVDSSNTEKESKQ